MNESEHEPAGQAGRSEVGRLKQQLRACLGDGTLASARDQGRAQFSPSLSYGRHFGPPTPAAKPAAVMLLLEPRENGWCIPLTRRPNHLPDHPGQISFPGGRLEGNETYQQAAEREFGEELGVRPFPGEVIGRLQPLYVYNSNYFVWPFVAVCDHAQDYTPFSPEVEQLIHLPLRCLIDRRYSVQASFSRGLVTWKALTIQFEQAQIWGATAIMLGEFAAIARRMDLFAEAL